MFYSVRSCTSNTSSVFQRNANFYLIHVFIFITSLLHVSVCYVHHLQGESHITCAKPSVFFFVEPYCCVGFELFVFGILIVVN